MIKLDKFVMSEAERKRYDKDMGIDEKARKLMAITDTYRSNPIRLKDFVPQGDGWGLDKRTGLKWMRCNLGKTWDGSACSGNTKEYTWKEAKNACSSYGRLPNIWELETLVYCSSGKDRGRGKSRFLHDCKGKYQEPTLNKKSFPNSNNWTWSSTTDASTTSYAWYVTFGDGGDGWDNKSTHGSVRCVR